MICIYEVYTTTPTLCPFEVSVMPMTKEANFSIEIALNEKDEIPNDALPIPLFLFSKSTILEL